VEDLKKLRGMADWTQTRTARVCGVPRTKLSQAECGELQLSPSEEAAVRRVLLAAIRERAARMQTVLTNLTDERQATAVAAATA